MKKRLFCLLFVVLPWAAFADDFEIITVVDKVQMSANIKGAITVGKDFRPTNDPASTLRKFQTRMDFLDDKGVRQSGYVLGVSIVDCQARTHLQGPIWYYIDDDYPPSIIPPQKHTKPSKTAMSFILPSNAFAIGHSNIKESPMFACDSSCARARLPK